MSSLEPTGARAGLSRERVVGAARDVVQRSGLDALSMRSLADELHIKAPSLYWHVRDRDELLRLLAEASLAEVPPPERPTDWRADAHGICQALRKVVAQRRDAARLLLAVPDALAGSTVQAALAECLSMAGVPQPVANETATMLLAWVLVDALLPSETDEEPPTVDEQVALLAVDSGVRGAVVRAGNGMRTLMRPGRAASGFSNAEVRGHQVVVVRHAGGGRQGEVELNPSVPWRFRVHGSTWNTRLDLRGLDVREVHVDSGAVRVECLLPAPRGQVLLNISGGVVDVRLRRPVGTPVVAEINGGVVQVRLDEQLVRATAGDVRWESVRGAAQADHYLLRIHSGAVRLRLEEDATLPANPPPAAPRPARRAGFSAAVEVVLDGVAAAANQARTAG